MFAPESVTTPVVVFSMLAPLESTAEIVPEYSAKVVSWRLPEPEESTMEPPSRTMLKDCESKKPAMSIVPPVRT